MYFEMSFDHPLLDSMPSETSRTNVSTSEAKDSKDCGWQSIPNEIIRI